MINWELVTEDILKLIDVDEDNFPIFEKVSVQSAKYSNADCTMFRDGSNSGTPDYLYLFSTNDIVYTLYTLFHECWHCRQKNAGTIIKYTEADKNKYVGKNHMMMIYNYDFEAEATGYASAFIYILYKMANAIKKNNLTRDIMDTYDTVESYPQDQFDSYDDYIKINEKIKRYYDEGKEYFISQFSNDPMQDELKLLLKNKKDIDEYSLYILSNKGLVLLRINNRLA